MAYPSGYTEATLKAYMHTVLTTKMTGSEILGWSVASGDYDEAVNESLAVYGVDDITTISGRDNIRLLRAIARQELWRAVATATAGFFDYDHGDSDAVYKRSQVHKQAKSMLALAEAEVEALGGDSDYEVTGYEIEYTDDIYVPYESDSSNEWNRVTN